LAEFAFFVAQGTVACRVEAHVAGPNSVPFEINAMQSQNTLFAAPSVRIQPRCGLKSNHKRSRNASAVTMTKKLLFVTTILLAFTLMAIAADVTGKWVYEQPGRGGGNPTPVTLNLKADGGKITGTQSRAGRDGNMMESPIKEGKIDGNNVSFKVTMQMGGNEITSDFVGTLEGDALKLKVTRPGRDGAPVTTEVTAKKSTT
jgi:hypothetical protein